MSLKSAYPSVDREHELRRGHLLAGSLAVAWLLFGSRWGSYVGAAPIFLTDVLIAAAVAHAAVSSQENNRGVFEGTRRPHALLFALLVWTLLRVLLSPDFTLDMLRDAVPYLYSFLAILAGWSLKRSTASGRARTARLLLWALGLHALWVGVVRVLAPTLPDRLPVVAPSQGLSLFETRTDFEPALVAVFAGWLAILVVQRRAQFPLLCLLGFVGCWVTILAMGSRAALLGSVLVMVLAGAAILASPGQSRNRKLEFTLVIGVVFAIAVAVVPTTTPGQRLLGGLGINLDEEATHSAQGTADARVRAQRILLGYCADNTQCATVGIGYGPNYMAETGALYALTRLPEQEAAPRAPHNYWLNTLIRGGLVGLVLVGSLVGVLLARVRSLRRSLAADPLLYLAAAVPVGLLIPATLGVILESPFGAVPFWWCLGLVLAWPRPEG
jgi:O-antigen ligase